MRLFYKTNKSLPILSEVVLILFTKVHWSLELLLLWKFSR